MTTTLTLTLSPEAAAWLQNHVIEGAAASLEEAAAFAIENAAFGAALEKEDLEWVTPLLDEARADMERGNTVPFSEFKAAFNARIVALGGTPRP